MIDVRCEICAEVPQSQLAPWHECVDEPEWLLAGEHLQRIFENLPKILRTTIFHQGVGFGGCARQCGVPERVIKSMSYDGAVRPSAGNYLAVLRWLAYGGSDHTRHDRTD